MGTLYNGYYYIAIYITVRETYVLRYSCTVTVMIRQSKHAVNAPENAIRVGGTRHFSFVSYESEKRSYLYVGANIVWPSVNLTNVLPAGRSRVN